jgi:hypothetical protein
MHAHCWGRGQTDQAPLCDPDKPPALKVTVCESTRPSVLTQTTFELQRAAWVLQTPLYLGVTQHHGQPGKSWTVI